MRCLCAACVVLVCGGMGCDSRRTCTLVETARGAELCVALMPNVQEVSSTHLEPKLPLDALPMVSLSPTCVIEPKLLPHAQSAALCPICCVMPNCCVMLCHQSPSLPLSLSLSLSLYLFPSPSLFLHHCPPLPRVLLTSGAGGASAVCLSCLSSAVYAWALIQSRVFVSYLFVRT